MNLKAAFFFILKLLLSRGVSKDELKSATELDYNTVLKFDFHFSKMPSLSWTALEIVHNPISVYISIVSHAFIL